jgi:hypothetical protein
MADKGKAALTGAASGAAAGAVLGPWGAAAGGVIGGALGYFGAEDDVKAPEYNPNHANFQYGLGPSDSYASLQSEQYNQRQAELRALGADAYNREGPTMALPDRVDHVGSQGQSYLQGADAEARRRQLEALGGMQGQVGQLNKFAQAPMGPSAAQAQLQAGTDMASRQQLGMARTQPGGGGAAMRNAAFNVAGLHGNAANSSAMLTAQETQAHRAQQLQALGAAQQGAGQIAGVTGQMRGADQGFAQAQAGQANYDAAALNQYGQQQQQLQFGVGQANLQAAGQARGQNDAATLGALGQSMAYEGFRNQNAAGQAQAGYNYEAARAQGAGLGAANYNAGVAQGNAETGMMLGALSSAAGAYGQMSGGSNPNPTSDVRAKKDIKPTSVLAALGGRYTPDQTRQLYAEQTGTGHVRDEVADVQDIRARGGVDQSFDEFRAAPPIMQGTNAARDARLQALLGPRPDLRPAQGYEYAYRDPEQNGEGRYVGPMAQDLEHLPGIVETKPGGEKAINAPRLTLANTAALSEQQRQDELDRQRLERLEQLAALGGQVAPPPSAFPRPNVQPPNYAALGPAGYHY